MRSDWTRQVPAAASFRCVPRLLFRTIRLVNPFEAKINTVYEAISGGLLARKTSPRSTQILVSLRFQ